MSQHYPALIILIPLFAALLCAAANWLNKRFCFPVVVGALSASLIASIALLIEVLERREIVYYFAGWRPPIGINYAIDSLNSGLLIVILGVALLNAVATRKLVSNDFPDKIGSFYALYLLFVAGLIGMVATGDAFNLYVLLEIASLTGYALIGFGQDRAPLAGLNYLFMGTIGASFYLLGVGHLYMVTGSLNMGDLANLLPHLQQSGVVLFAFLFCLVGLFLKMAFFPLHGWLPNAYTYAPSASSSLIAPLTTKVMIYVMIRIVLDVFGPSFVFDVLVLKKAIVWLAVLAIIMSSLFALAQRRIKRMLAYIIITEVGYMVGGFWLANRAGMIGSVLHIINDALMTFCVFLAAGIMYYKLGSDSFHSLKGLFRKMPFTMAGFVVGGFSIIGIPPTCGFFSKWYLLLGGLEAGQYAFVFALLFSSLINVILFFRIFEICYYEPFSDTDHGGHHQVGEVQFAEAPMEMVIPLLIVAALLVGLGFYAGDIVSDIITHALPVNM